MAALLGVDLLDLDGLALAQRHVDIARMGLRSSKPGSIAYIQGHRALREATAALAEQRKPAEDERDPVNETPEQWRQRVLDDAMSCSDADREVYVGVWLDRMGYDLANEGGVLRLVRRPL